ncbi:unnamed protein product, partial [marine sediment metagenome]
NAYRDKKDLQFGIPYKKIFLWGSIIGLIIFYFFGLSCSAL